MPTKVYIKKKGVLIPEMQGMYASFPTFTTYKDKVYVFYRLGIKDCSQCHGTGGRVMTFILNKNEIEPVCVFESENEIDAIVSKVDDFLYTLCTRTFIKDKIGRTYVSFSDSPVFRKRTEVKVPGVSWFVFYGKSFRFQDGVVFPAYGVIEGEDKTSPFILYTKDLKTFGLYVRIPAPDPDTVLNENSIVFTNGRFCMFIRQDTQPFGLWFSESTDLKSWGPVKKIIDSAHAPIAVNYKNTALLMYRNLDMEGQSSIALSTPFADVKHTVIDTYYGNLFDGGYGDITALGNDVFIIYYHGNINGQPCIKLAELEIT